MNFAEHQLPRAYHLKCLSNLSEEEIESGFRDSVPSKTVLKHIRYEARKGLTPFEDESKTLSEIHSQQQQYCTVEMITIRFAGWIFGKIVSLQPDKDIQKLLSNRNRIRNPDIRNAFINISRIRTFGKSCTLRNHSFIIFRIIF